MAPGLRDCVVSHSIHSPVSRLAHERNVYANRPMWVISLGTPNILGFTPIEPQTCLRETLGWKGIDDFNSVRMNLRHAATSTRRFNRASRRCGRLAPNDPFSVWDPVAGNGDSFTQIRGSSCWLFL